MTQAVLESVKKEAINTFQKFWDSLNPVKKQVLRDHLKTTPWHEYNAFRYSFPLELNALKQAGMYIVKWEISRNPNYEDEWAVEIRNFDRLLPEILEIIMGEENVTFND